MQFSLPSNLKEQLATYDPAIEKLFNSSKPKEPKKVQYLLGIPEDLIPEHIVEKDRCIEAVKHMNQQEASQRYYVFTEHSYDQDMQSVTTLKAFIYHFQSMWIAAWLPNKDENYIFGYTYAFKSAESTLNKIPSVQLIDIDLTEDKIQKYGRTKFYVNTELVTKDNILGKKRPLVWKHYNSNSYSTKCRDIYRNVIKPFEETLTSSIPHWKDKNSSIFDRIDPKTNNYNNILYLNHFGNKYKNAIPNFNIYLDYAALFSSDKTYCKIEKILNTPWFKKHITSSCQLIIEKFNDPKTEYKIEFIKIHDSLIHNIRWIANILEIYPDCPVDFFRTAVDNDTFNWIYFPYVNICDCSKWLSTNMPIDSWFKILTKFAEESEINHNSVQADFDPSRLKIKYRFYALEDTLSMLSKIFDAGKTIEPPKRWRIKELHDHVQSEAWKISNPKEKLPQDLFPEPIKIQDNGTTWTFFQPIDTHQLSTWGQAVHNCVGSSSIYAEKVKAKEEFLVLCLLNGTPRFTIQLKIDNSVMHVIQIAGIANARLSSEEREQYQCKFAEALEIRESSLCSV